jgi:hypothetical protein
MRRLHVPALAAVLALMPAVAQASDCAKDVKAAFEKQRTVGSYRAVTRQASPEGELVNTVDYVAPDKMHNTVVAPGQPHPLETIAIGRWAWANQGGGWQELQPQFAQSVTSHVTATLGTAIGVGEVYVCSGKITRDGRTYTAYQTTPKLAVAGRPESAENPVLARTILVDPDTGLPAFNIVGSPKAEADPVMAVAYSYPKDLKIEAPDAVPATRTR